MSMHTEALYWAIIYWNLHISFIDAIKEDKKDYPVLLWWTGRLYVSRTELQLSRCNNDVYCYTTSNRKYFKDKRTRGFMFYGTDIEAFSGDFPLPRALDHEWALFHEESPMNNFMLVHRPMINLFNHTATFRRESNFPLTTFSLTNLAYLTDRKPVPTETKNQLRVLKDFAPVLFVQSHCDVASDRDRFVRELMKHIAVDSYGSCVHNKDLPSHLTDPVESMHAEEFYQFIAQYKFHLSIENAFCNDYITEKLWRSLHVGSVVIYKGSATVRDWLPSNNSVVMIDDFSSIKELADYIKYLDENDDAYNEVLSYKTTGVTNPKLITEMNTRFGRSVTSAGTQVDPFQNFQCYVCEKISKNYKFRTEQNVAHVSHLYCPQPFVSVGDISALPSNDSWLQHHWIDSYWSGLDQGMALERMIANNESNPRLFDKYWRQVSQENPRPNS